MPTMTGSSVAEKAQHVKPRALHALNCADGNRQYAEMGRRIRHWRHRGAKTRKKGGPKGPHFCHI